MHEREINLAMSGLTGAVANPIGKIAVVCIGISYTQKNHSKTQCATRCDVLADIRDFSLYLAYCKVHTDLEPARQNV